MNPSSPSWFHRYWPLVLLSLVPLGVLGALWANIPDTIPTHWNAKGEIDDYGSKWTLLIVPLTSLLMVTLVSLLLRIDPKGKINQSESTIFRILLAMIFFFWLVFGLILATSLGYEVQTAQWILVGVLVLFAVLGNYFGKLRHNYFVGIRTPWTLENEQVWNKTHRFAGKLWVYGSLLMLIPAMLTQGEWFFFLLLGFILVIVIVPLVYSYQLFQRLGKQG